MMRKIDVKTAGIRWQDQIVMVVNDDPIAISDIEMLSGVARLWSTHGTSPREMVLPSIRHFVCWRRFLSTWMAPEFGRSLLELPQLPQGQMLACEMENGETLVLLPLVSRHARWVVRGNQGSVLLEATWTDSSDSTKPLPMMVAASAADPFDAIAHCLEAARVSSSLGPLRAPRHGENLLSQLGVCTWDAFYQEVSETKVESLLSAFGAQGIRPGWLILDDGWQDAFNDRLRSFRAHPDKLSGDLAAAIRGWKKHHSLDAVGVWLAVGGHWKGIDPESSLATRYPLACLESGDPNDPTSKREKRWHVRPEAAGGFYEDWMRELAEAGVDFVKIDNQGNFPFAVAGSGQPLLWVEAHLQAIDSAVNRHFKNPSLSCMSHGSEEIWQYRSHGWWRSSRDYFPARPHSHGRHLVMNAWNAAVAINFALPDWDMFQSGGACGEFHAAARVLSGGPVYLSDSAESLNPDVIASAIAWDGYVLRCTEPARLLSSRFYLDCESERRLLVVQGSLPCGGMSIGFFHCRWSPESHESLPLYDEVRLAELGVGEGWMWHRVGTRECAPAADRIGTQLNFGEFAFFQLLRPLKGVTAIGLADAYLPAAAIVEEMPDHECPAWQIRGGGRFLLHSRNVPTEVRFDGNSMPWQRHGEIIELSLPPCNGLLECG